MFVNKHFANFTSKQFENSKDSECIILRVLFLYEQERTYKEIFKPALLYL